MSDGGLLKKAMDVQQPADEIVAVAAPEAEKKTLVPNSLYIGIGLAVVSIVSMWLYSLPSIQSEYALAIIVPILLAGAGWFLIWDGVNRKFTEVISVTILLLLASPFISSSLFSSSLTITDSDLSSDAETITLTIRESGGFFGGSSGDADVSITYGGEKVWESVMPLSINLNDANGKYGRLVLPIDEFYSGNAATDSRYIVTVDSGSSSDSFILNSGHLARTVDTTQNLAVGAMGQGNDCSGNKDSCVIGVGLKAWVGLQTNVGNPPAPLPHANFELTATLSKDGVTAISYPTVTVINGDATWDSMNGEYGSGSAVVGDFGSEIVLDGSVEDIAINMQFIPREDWEESDFGCYEFTVSATQGPPWGDRTAHVSTTYYELAEFGGGDDGSDTDESWTQVSSC
jgi:hypothetical protein|tara:strand:- start:60245 stop:61447 length:1203 start_codon:yes stop_codon:yes gene_type:complete